MHDTEIVSMEHVAPLQDDDVPDANQSHNCFSCNENMTGLYCHACGNKNDNYRRSIWSLGAELFSSLTAFEGRIWKSLRSLILKPGQMAREYSDGARQKWTSPIRLFLATSLLLFGYVAISQTQLVAFGTKKAPNSAFKASGSGKHFSPQLFFLERKSTLSKIVSDETISEFEDNMGNIIDRDSNQNHSALDNELRLAEINLKQINTQLDTIKIPYAKPGLLSAKKALEERIKRIETSIARRKNTKAHIDNEKNNDAVVKGPTKNDTVKEVEDNGSDIRIVDMKGNEFNLDSQGFKQASAIALRQPERINEPVNKYLSRIMFFMMPFSMLMGAIFIRGKEKAMLYDHLVHAAYVHAFAFLLLFIFILLVQFTPVKGLIWIYSAILLIYLPLSAKHMFSRGWFKTFLTSYGVGTIYTLVMLIILGSLTIWGLVDIAKEVATTN